MESDDDADGAGGGAVAGVRLSRHERRTKQMQVRRCGDSRPGSVAESDPCFASLRVLRRRNDRTLLQGRGCTALDYWVTADHNCRRSASLRWRWRQWATRTGSCVARRRLVRPAIILSVSQRG